MAIVPQSSTLTIYKDRGQECLRITSLRLRLLRTVIHSELGDRSHLPASTSLHVFSALQVRIRWVVFRQR
jgi:hypothetical protein